MSEENNEIIFEEKKQVSTKEVKGKKNEEKVVQTKKVAPKIFFDPNSKIEVSVNCYYLNSNGEYQFAVVEENDEFLSKEEDALFTKYNFKFWFTRCPYDKYNRYRNKSIIYNQEDQNNSVNEIRLREFFLVFHLVDWNLTDENGNKIELKFDPNKSLSDESLNLIYTLPANLIDVVLSTYERKMSV